MSDDGKKQKEIGQIVSLLQDDVMLGSAINHFDPYYNSTQFNNCNSTVQSAQNYCNTHHCLLSLPEYPNGNNINNDNSNNLQNAYLKTQPYFMNINENNINFNPIVSTDLTVNSPIESNNHITQLKNHSNPNNLTFFETTQLNNSQLLSPIIESSSSNNVEYSLNSSVSNHLQYVVKKFSIKIDKFNFFLIKF